MPEPPSPPSAARALAAGLALGWGTIGAVLLVHASRVAAFHERAALVGAAVALAVALGVLARWSRRALGSVAVVGGSALAVASIVPLDVALRGLPPWAVGAGLLAAGALVFVAALRRRATSPSGSG